LGSFKLTRFSRPRAVEKSPRRSRWRAASLGVAVLAVVAVFVFAFGGAILGRFGKAKTERAYAEAYPGSTLRIGKLDYAVFANRLVAQRVTLSATNTTLEVGQVTLTGVRWMRLLWGASPLAGVLDQARLEATNLEVEFPNAHYRIRCARLRASVPDTELTAEGFELGPLLEDEAFFAAHEYRTTRFRIVLPESRVAGLAYGELLEGKAYRARSVHFSGPSFDALLNRDQPPPPFVKSPLMVHEALAAVRQPLRVDNLSITNANLSYAERLLAGADPGVLTFGQVSVAIDGITNRGGPTDAIQLDGQGELMNAGTLRVSMSIPIDPADFSLRYSGSLGPMDLTRLDAFLDPAERIRITSGTAQEATFVIEVTDGRALGRVRAVYDDLKIAVLDEETGTRKGFDNRLATILANVFKVRTSSAPGVQDEGQVNYARTPENTFLEFVWFALRSGVLDVISR
jgi:hypothetical protein